MRGVIDGFASAEEIATLYAIKPRVTPGQHNNIEQWRWAVEHPTHAVLVRRAQSVLEEHFGVRKLRFYRSNMITWLGQQAGLHACMPRT